MDQRQGICVRVVFLCSLVCLGWSEDIVYVSEGGTLRLQPVISGPFTSVVWKFNKDLIAEWDDGSETVYYDKFRGRAILIETTGELHVSKVNAQDLEGKFTVDLNNTAEAATITAMIIEPVPQPDIHPSPVACTHQSVRCTLHCGGDTSKAEPVKFQWKHDQKESSKSIVIDVNTQNVKSFSCNLSNPISMKESKPFKNPFYQDNTIGPGGITGLVLMFLVLIALIVGVLCWCHKKKRAAFGVNGEGRQPGDSAERVHLESNTTATT
ncbi:CD48 antigen-like [Dunckerocampus dactyliophorus]|uniref:CD48 antigen-like n=1 Tax=Dunckerocampus dactyliophorus TaxID=161453 RepID=UPI0024068FB3|nr:CD48 antigen-like [Dunckerocampus dactyliophorus]